MSANFLRSLTRFGALPGSIIDVVTKMNRKKSSPRIVPAAERDLQLPLFGPPPPAPDAAVAANRTNSDPLLGSVWLKLRHEYFPDRPDIDDYQILWSNRKQKRTLASCSIEQHKVRVARELNAPRCWGWLEPLLYHEMCHAYLGRTPEGYHGRTFRKLEKRHPLTKALEDWIKAGGWFSTVRSDRARRARARLVGERPLKLSKRR